MNSAVWFLVGGLLLLVLAVIFADKVFAGVLLAAGLGAIFGALRVLIGGPDGK